MFTNGVQLSIFFGKDKKGQCIKLFYVCFNSNIIQGEDLVPVKCKYTPNGLGCCPFLSNGSVVVNSLFNVAPNLCGGSVFGPSFVMQ